MSQVPVMNTTEAATYLGVSRAFLLRELRAGTIPCRHVRRRWLIPVAALDQWLKGNDVYAIQLARPHDMVSESSSPSWQCSEPLRHDHDRRNDHE